MPARKKAAPKIEMVTVRPEVWEQMWRVIDAARLISTPPRGTEEHDLRLHLADSEKMLTRAIAVFCGDEVVIRGAATKHPWTVEIEALDEELRERPFVALCTFSELGMGPNAERK